MVESGSGWIAFMVNWRQWWCQQPWVEEHPESATLSPPPPATDAAHITLPKGQAFPLWGKVEHLNFTLRFRCKNGPISIFLLRKLQLAPMKEYNLMGLMAYVNKRYVLQF